MYSLTSETFSSTHRDFSTILGVSLFELESELVKMPPKTVQQLRTDQQLLNPNNSRYGLYSQNNHERDSAGRPTLLLMLREAGNIPGGNRDRGEQFWVPSPRFRNSWSTSLSFWASAVIYSF